MKTCILLIALSACISVSAQQSGITLEQAILEGGTNNKSIQASALDVEYQKQIRRTSTDIGKTNVVYMQGQYNSYAKNDNNITISQSIPFPTVFSAQNSLGKSLIKSSELKQAATENDLAYQIKQVYYQLIYLKSLETLLVSQDSIFQAFVKAADSRYRTGETNLLEKTTVSTQRNEALNSLSLTQSDIRIYQQLLATLMGSNRPVTIAAAPFEERKLDIPLDSTSISQNPELIFQRQQVLIASGERKVASTRLMPDINVGYFNQTLINTPVSEGGMLATSSNRFQGFQIGLSIPVWIGPHYAKVKAARINEERTETAVAYQTTQLAGQWEQAVESYLKNKNSYDYYRTSALENADLILKHSELAFRNGEIDYIGNLLSVRNAIQIRERYLLSLNNLNQSIITLEFLSGNH
jgi:cobalt-zinc-cadmium resistance protein CzcA